jgi:hypothetical protein
MQGEVWAPTGKYQMQGITRGNVLALCKAHGIPCRELDFSLTQVGVSCLLDLNASSERTHRLGPVGYC